MEERSASLLQQGQCHHASTLSEISHSIRLGQRENYPTTDDTDKIGAEEGHKKLVHPDEWEYRMAR